MKKILWKNSMGLFIAGAILFLAAGFTMAQSRRIAVTPLNFEMTVERGEAKSDYITVLNPSYEDGVEVEMTIEDMFPEGEEGRVILSSPEEDLDIMAISRWITFEPREFSLEPREQKMFVLPSMFPKRQPGRTLRRTYRRKR